MDKFTWKYQYGLTLADYKRFEFRLKELGNHFRIKRKSNMTLVDYLNERLKR